MRSTRASAAVERLKSRTGNPHYSMVRSANGLFHLVSTDEAGETETIGIPLEQDEFVLFVNGLGPQPVRRATKSDLAFEKQLARKKDAV